MFSFLYVCGPAIDSRGDHVSDSGAVDSTPTAFHRPGLVVSDWPSTGESSLASPMAQIRGAWFAVVVIGFIEGYVLLPYGLRLFVVGVFLTALVVWRVAPKWLR